MKTHGDGSVVLKNYPLREGGRLWLTALFSYLKTVEKILTWTGFVRVNFYNEVAAAKKRFKKQRRFLRIENRLRC